LGSGSISGVNAEAQKISVKIEFSGGLELLFGKVKKHVAKFNENATLASVLDFIATKLIVERPEFFVQKGTVRPGILVLINDTDWELEGGLEYTVKNGDTLVFISTLHGG